MQRRLGDSRGEALLSGAYGLLAPVEAATASGWGDSNLDLLLSLNKEAMYAPLAGCSVWNLSIYQSINQ